MNILDQGSAFSVAFQWRGDASTVKAFPYMKLDPSRLPVQLWNASTLQFSAEWSMLVDGTESQSPQEQAAAYDNTALKANAAIDMFLSDDIANSTGLGSPIEIMIWLWYVPSMLPLGHSESTPEIDTVEVSGMNFSLYHGWNAQGQNVFSWLAHQNMTSANDDFSPLLRYIWKKGLLSGALYLGQIEFGTEVMHAGQSTTFSASKYELALYRDADDDNPSPKPTSTSSVSSTATATTSRASNTATTSSTAAPAPSANSAAVNTVSSSSFSSYQVLSLGVPLVVAFMSSLRMFGRL